MNPAVLTPDCLFPLKGSSSTETPEDSLTPYKLSLLILVAEYFEYREKAAANQNGYRTLLKGLKLLSTNATGGGIGSGAGIGSGSGGIGSGGIGSGAGAGSGAGGGTGAGGGSGAGIGSGVGGGIGSGAGGIARSIDESYVPPKTKEASMNIAAGRTYFYVQTSK